MNIIELAKKAGMLSINDRGLYGDFVNLERFAALVRAEALEESEKVCANAADKQIVYYPKGYYIDPNKFGEICQEQANRCAAAIRGLK